MKIKSVNVAVDLAINSIKHFNSNYCWFRGQSNAEWTLEPAVFRRTSSGEFIFDEYNLTYEMRLVKPDVYSRINSAIEWLAYAQHYGLPTRLLDWSESILVALFFASIDDQTDGKIFVLVPSILNTITSLFGYNHICLPDFADANLRALQALSANFNELHARLKQAKIQYKMSMDEIKKERLIHCVNLPVAVEPPRINSRITVQSSMFTVHGGNSFTLSHKSDFGEPVTIEEICKDNPMVLSEYIVPSKDKPAIRRELMSLGINEGSLFPEFESQANYIKNKWKVNF